MGDSIKEKSSPYIGVRKVRNRFLAVIIDSGNRIQIGRFMDEKEAAKAYDKYVIRNNLNRPTNFLKKRVVISE